MTLRHYSVFAVAVLLIALLSDVAWASPLKQITSMFDDAVDLFLKKLIPGLAATVIAWNAIMIAVGRKTFLDCVAMIAGAAMALAASLIVGYLSGGAG